jgi:hypothetical protein
MGKIVPPPPPPVLHDIGGFPRPGAFCAVFAAMSFIVFAALMIIHFLAKAGA